MICPFCNSGDTNVIDSRRTSDNSIRRRRECLKCGQRFTTYEKAIIPLSVVKRDGRIENFSREKLRNSITKACYKRPVSVHKIGKITEMIERKIRKEHSTRIKSSEIGENVLQLLKDIDKIAYMRFASIYHNFDIASFEKEAKALAGEAN